MKYAVVKCPSCFKLQLCMQNKRNMFKCRFCNKSTKYFIKQFESDCVKLAQSYIVNQTGGIKNE